MGQAKHNPTAIAAKEGKLPPKPNKISKRAWEQMIIDQLPQLLLSKYLKKENYNEEK